MNKFDIESRPADSALVGQVWRARTDRPGSFMSVASVHCQIVVTHHHDRIFVTIRAPETRPTVMHFPADAAWLGIDWRLGAFLPDFPPRSLLNQRDATLPAATSQSFWLHRSARPLPIFDTAEVVLHPGVDVRINCCWTPLVAALRVPERCPGCRYVQCTIASSALPGCRWHCRGPERHQGLRAGRLD